MTFDARERSAEDGAKVFTYTWVRGSRFYRYVAADQDVVLDFQRFIGSGSIRHGQIEQGGEPLRSQVEVIVDMDHEVAALYRATAPVDSVVLTIHAYHVGDEADRHPVWQGRITGVKWDPAGGRAVITHDPTYTSLRRTGLRRNYQDTCPLVWGGARCRLNREAFAVATTAQEIAGQVITTPDAALHPDGWYDGGMLTYEIESGVVERRFIRSHVGTDVTVTAPLVGLVHGAAIKLYPGDDHTAQTCHDKFGNLDNFGGFPYFPKKNPFGGSPMY